MIERKRNLPVAIKSSSVKTVGDEEQVLSVKINYDKIVLNDVEYNIATEEGRLAQETGAQHIKAHQEGHLLMLLKDRGTIFELNERGELICNAEDASKYRIDAETGILYYDIVYEDDPEVDFLAEKTGGIVEFTDESTSGTSWLWSFGDGTYSTEQNPYHLYTAAGSYTVILTVDGAGSHTEVITIALGLQMLFSTALVYYGTIYDEYGTNPTYNALLARIRFRGGADTAGAENHWTRRTSKIGGYDLIPDNVPEAILPEVVGMGAWINEIYHYTNSLSGAAGLQQQFNDTNIDFFAVVAAYVKQHKQVFLYTANISHGTVAEMAEFLAYLTLHDIPFEVKYGNEMSVGSSSMVPEVALTSAEYLALLPDFHDYMTANYPHVRVTINTAKQTTVNWSQANVAAFAIANNIPSFNQYCWLGDNAGAPNTNTDLQLYFDQAYLNLITTGSDSLYVEVLPRLLVYAGIFNGMEMEISQWGISLQRSGYVVQTMFHGIGLMNMVIEFIKFNMQDNGITIRNAVFLVNESAVDKAVVQDSLFTIDSHFTETDGDGNEFIMKVPGATFELLKDIHEYSGTPIFIEVNMTGAPAGLGCLLAVLGTTVILYVYNYGGDATIVSITADVVVLSGDVEKTTIWAEKPWGSIGTAPYYSQFHNNPSPVAIVNVERIFEEVSAANVLIKKNSISKIVLLEIEDASTIAISF